MFVQLFFLLRMAEVTRQAFLENYTKDGKLDEYFKSEKFKQKSFDEQHREFKVLFHDPLEKYRTTAEFKELSKSARKEFSRFANVVRSRLKRRLKLTTTSTSTSASAGETNQHLQQIIHRPTFKGE